MATVIPLKVRKRLLAGVKRFRPILETARLQRAVEADTATIVKEILSEVFGYDKFTEITAEFVVKHTFCDIAVRLDGKPKPDLLVEVKAIGYELKEAHMIQAIDYAAKEGVDWVVLTNGATWQLYEVVFDKPISWEMVLEFDLQSLNTKRNADLESLFVLTRESLRKGYIRKAADRQRGMNRYNLSAIILSDEVLAAVRRRLKKMSPKLNVGRDELRAALEQDVLKREVTEGDQARNATKKLAKVLKAKTKRVGRTVKTVASGEPITGEDS